MLGKCKKRFGETATFTPEIVDALIHRLCLDKMWNETQRVKRRAGKAANTEATPGPGSALVSIIRGLNPKPSLTSRGLSILVVHAINTDVGRGNTP